MSFPLVYVGVVSDSYFTFFKSRCLAKTTTKLGMVYRVQKQTKHPVFWICGPLRAFCGFLAGCLPGVLVGFLVFADSVQKCFEQEEVGGVPESDPHAQPQCTIVQPQEMLLTCAGEGRNMLKHSKCCSFLGFWAFQFWMTIPQKARRLRP